MPPSHGRISFAMSEKPEKSRGGWWPTATVLSILLGLYITGYFVLGKHTVSVGSIRYVTGIKQGVHVRSFPLPHMHKAYWPMGFLESVFSDEYLVLTNDHRKPGGDVAFPRWP